MSSQYRVFHIYRRDRIVEMGHPATPMLGTINDNQAICKLCEDVETAFIHVIGGEWQHYRDPEARLGQ